MSKALPSLVMAWALAGGFAVYGVLKLSMGLRLSAEEEYDGADLSLTASR